jgi:hypothetical protein
LLEEKRVVYIFFTFLTSNNDIDHSSFVISL